MDNVKVENQIGLLMLAVGEDVVGRLVYEDDDVIVVGDALILHMDLENTGQLAFQKFCMLTNTWDVTLNKSQIISVFDESELSPSVVEFYKNTMKKFSQAGPITDIAEDLFSEDMEDEEFDTNTKMVIH